MSLTADFFRALGAFEASPGVVCRRLWGVEAREEDVRAATPLGAGADRALEWAPEPCGGRGLDVGCGRGRAGAARRVSHGPGFVAGTLVTSWAWMVFVTLVIRTYPVTMGEWGESFTREVLASRDFGWPFLDDVAMEHRNIDHVVVSPRAVLAIETKFVGAGRQWATDRHREAAMDGARSSARSVRSILLS